MKPMGSIAKIRGMLKGTGKEVGQGVKDILRDKAFWGGGAVTAAAYGAGAGASHIDKALDGRRKVRAYKGMLEANPALTKKDSSKTQAYFNSMYRVAPTLARDPYVAGAWVHNVIDNEDPHDPRPNYTLLSAVQDLAGAGKSVLDSQRIRREMSPNVQAAAAFGKSLDKGFDQHLKSQNDFAAGRVEGKQEARAAIQNALQSQVTSSPSGTTE